MLESSAPFQLVEVVDLGVLQEIQDRFADLGHLSMRILDSQDRLVTQPTCASRFCRMLQTLSQDRFACDGRTNGEREKTNGNGAPPESRTGPCFAELIQHRVDITVDGHTFGTIVAADRPHGALSEETLRQLARDWQVDRAELAAAVANLPVMTPERLRNREESLQLLAQTTAMLARQGIELRNRMEELATVYELTGMLAGTDRLQHILDAVALRVCEVLKVKACGVRLLDEETGELVVKAVHNLSPRYLQKVRVKLGDNQIDSAAFAGETVYIEDAPNDPRIRYPEEARAEGIVSGLCVPMTYRGKTVGVLRIYADRKMRFAPAVQALARAVASQSAAAIVTACMNADRRAAEQYQQQLRTAGEIQRRMIPSQPPPHARISFGAVYEPTLAVGGDFYDFLELPKGNLGLCIADVVGKGIGAGLMMASVRAALRAHAESIYHIDQIVSRVNRHLCRDKLMSEFTTLFYGVFSPDGRWLTYCNAGHDPPLLCRAGKIQRLTSGGTVLGLRPDAVFDREVIGLESGDSLVFYTDGMVDALDFDKKRFGRTRLEDSLLANSQADAVTLAQQLLWDVRRFVGLAQQSDDISLVAAKVR